jgi:hypothetical protein
MKVSFRCRHPPNDFIGKDKPDTDPAVGEIRRITTATVDRNDNIVLVAGTEPAVDE